MTMTVTGEPIISSALQYITTYYEKIHSTGNIYRPTQTLPWLTLADEEHAAVELAEFLLLFPWLVPLPLVGDAP